MLAIVIAFTGISFGNVFATQNLLENISIEVNGESVPIVSSTNFELNNSVPASASENVSGIAENDSQSTSSGFSAFSALDQAPVAGLEYMLYGSNANLIDGQVSTYTQIAWIWANETYHPDGTAITDYSIWGTPTTEFNNSILGYLTSNGQYVGFVTQFPSGGEYTLYFQVEDENGVQSNVYSTTINVREMGFSDLDVSYDLPENLSTYPYKFYFNGYTLLSAAASTTEAQVAYDNAKINTWPGGNSRIISDLDVTGYVKYGNGSPVANKTVRVVLTGTPYQDYYVKDVTTNANGYFSATATSYLINTTMGGYYNVSGIGYGDMRTYTNSIIYASDNGAIGSYHYPGNVYVYTPTDDAYFEQSMYLNVGGTINGMLLANKWLKYNGSWYDF